MKLIFWEKGEGFLNRARGEHSVSVRYSATSLFALTDDQTIKMAEISQSTMVRPIHPEVSQSRQKKNFFETRAIEYQTADRLIGINEAHLRIFWRALYF